MNVCARGEDAIAENIKRRRQRICGEFPEFGNWFWRTRFPDQQRLASVIALGHVHVKMKKFYEVGDHVIAVGRVSGCNKMTGRELDAAVAATWTLCHGKAVRCQSYHEPAKWLEVPGEIQAQDQRLAA